MRFGWLPLFSMMALVSQIKEASQFPEFIESVIRNWMMDIKCFTQGSIFAVRLFFQLEE